jgi:Bax protein
MPRFAWFVWIALLMPSLGLSQSKTYFQDHRHLADSLSAVYKIPSCVILAVAYVESGGGVSNVAKKLNNHFGMAGNCQFETSGYRSKYKYFPTARASYVGFCELIKSKRFYPELVGSVDEKKWLTSIASTGYAADPVKWSGSVYNVISERCK